MTPLDRHVHPNQASKISHSAQIRQIHSTCITKPATTLFLKSRGMKLLIQHAAQKTNAAPISLLRGNHHERVSCSYQPQQLEANSPKYSNMANIYQHEDERLCPTYAPFIAVISLVVLSDVD